MKSNATWRPFLKRCPLEILGALFRKETLTRNSDTDVDSIRKLKSGVIMKILALLGSPRKKGNTETLLDQALEGVLEKLPNAEIKKVHLNDMTIVPCQSCGGCLKTGSCVRNDDMSDIYSDLGDSDILILASPVYFGMVSAQTKAVIDRCQCFWAAKYLLGKRLGDESKRKAAFICASAMDRKDFFENSESVARNFFATVDFDYTGGEYFPTLEGKKDAAGKTEFLERAKGLGRKIAAAVIES